uniref:Protein kinase domain-containing protein n=1 Tax=Davidia involucrata TaxID=16924 RepID=A0A5B7C268_DAVIN
MEQTEEMAANNVAAGAELKRKDCDPPMKTEGCNMLSSPALCVSACSECPESSAHVYTHTHTLEGDTLNQRISLAGSEPPCNSPCSLNDGGLMVEELIVRNCNTPNIALVSSSNIREGMNSRHGKWPHLYQLAGRPRSSNMYGDFASRDKDPVLLCAKKDLQRMPFGVRDLKPLSSKQNNQDPEEISTHFTDSYNKIISSNTVPLGDDRSKILSTSSFSQFFAKKSLKGKGVLSKTPEAHVEFGPAAMDQHNEKQVFVSRVASDVLLNSSDKNDQPSQHSVDSGGLESFHDGISLREWLKPGCHGIHKAERLHLFRQIVQLVDFAHSQGVVLQDIRPSCFILLPSNRVKYSGSSTQRELHSVMREYINRKRPLEQEMQASSYLGVKQQKLGENIKSVRHSSQVTSRCSISSEAVNGIHMNICSKQDFGYIGFKARNNSSYKNRQQSNSVSVQLEEQWYACPEELNKRGLLSSNIYSLGVILFELLCYFESSVVHSAAMLDLRNRILPPNFLSENPMEAGFCLWLLHPEPSCRPTTREILHSELICGIEELNSGDDLSSYPDEDDDDAESELLLHFLLSLKEKKQKHASKLVEDIGCLEADLKEIETSSDWMHNSLPDATKQGPHFEEHIYPGVLSRSLTPNMLERRLMSNLSQLGNAYFSVRSQIQLTETANTERADKDLLRNRERWSGFQNENEDQSMEPKPVDRLEAFFEGLCKFARFSKFEVCGTLRNSDLLNTANVICSLSFDRDEDYIAAAGVSKKIKIFEFGALLNDSVDIHYPVVEMSNKSKLSCVCWNNYINNYLASTDYDGVVQIWDASTGQAFSQYVEHQKRAWSVDFSQVDPMKFASGSDDCSVKLWSINEKSSISTIRNPANVCCVQFSSYSSNLLAFGSADYKIYCYDLRHIRIPWCTLAGHGKAVSYVKFLDLGTLVSASTDNTIKLWDLNKTSSEGLSSSACSLTFRGHTNEKNFVGLSVFDGYIACGSETNEVYTYYRSLPMPITSHKFGSIDPISGHKNVDDNGQFVSSVCWRGKSNMVVAANSSGSMKLLRMV